MSRAAKVVAALASEFIDGQQLRPYGPGPLHPAPGYSTMYGYSGDPTRDL